MVWHSTAVYASIEEVGVVSKLKKDQDPQIRRDREVGIIIDCDEIVISVYPPPREHGKPHCHVISKKSCKVKGLKLEVYPEVKIYLDGSEVVIVTKGFSKKDLQVIGDIIFNDTIMGRESNDTYLLNVWEKLHGQYEKK